MSQQLAIGKKVKERYAIQAKLGNGAYGTVYRVYDEKEKQEKAMKVIQMRKPKNYKYAVDEVKVLKELRGIRGIQQIEHVFELKSLQCIIGELYMSDLDMLKNNNRDRESRYLPATTLQIAFHGVKSLKAIHERGFLHRDLKLGNMMIPYDQKDGKVVVVDFGMACRYRASTAFNARRIKTPNRDYAFNQSPYHALRMALFQSPQESEDLEMLAYCLLDCRGLTLFGGNAKEMIEQKEAFAADPSSFLRRKDKFLSNLIQVLLEQPHGDSPRYDEIFRKIKDWKTHGVSMSSTADFHILQWENGKLFMD